MQEKNAGKQQKMLENRGKNSKPWINPFSSEILQEMLKFNGKNVCLYKVLGWSFSAESAYLFAIISNVWYNEANNLT